MKKSTLLMMVLCLLTLQLSAQQKNPEKEKEAVQLATQPSSISLQELIQQKSSSYVITNENVSRLSGIRHVYLRQAINGMEVYGTESSVHFDKTGMVIKEHNKFLTDVQTTLKNSSQGINARAAINAVANQMGYKVSNLQEVKNIGGKNKVAIFNRAGISLVEIPTKLMYYYKEGIGTQLIWELSIAETTSSDWWNFRVNASTGKIIDKDNWTVSCNIMDGHNEHFHSGEHEAITSFIGPLNETDAPISHKESSETKVFEDTSALVGGYRVYAMPMESPNHGSMTRTLENNPDDATASPFGWHDINGSPGAEFTETRGNNADVHKDTDRPDGGASLTFDFPIDLNQNPASNTAPYITNLFYWTNITHDVMYQYGFDEVSGNFQENNYGNGGLGSDSVNVNAQASGNCNANFGTPNDGGNPTMNMYLCNNSTPSHDSGLDAGVIVHEYGHGISNRLTGGPGNTGCLGNGEQMGEGWSDFYGLLLTIESGDTGTDARGVGTYLLGEPANGPGIRTQMYSTDFAVNNHTYDDIKTTTAVHYRGEVWATMLWDMTWEIIGTDGFDTDFYNGSGGNNVALAIVTEGLRLQPCSPGFVDGRDAILAADQALYGGAHYCQIWEAFARRGLGFSASQGSSNSSSDGTEAFDLPPGFSGLNTIDEVCLADGIQTGLSGGTPAGGVYSGPGVTDNGGTFTFDPSVGGPGLVTVSYLVNDFCTGAPTTLTDDINVTNNPPEIICVGSGLIPMSGSSSISPGTTISDNTTITSTLIVTDDVSITDLNVDLNINHTWVSDLVITLESPAGTVITIFDPSTCSGDDVIILLDDEAPTTSSACYGTGTDQAFPDPSYQPFASLSAFDGENTVGDWILRVSDNAGGDTGTLNSWGIDYDYEVTAPVLDVTLDGSGNATINAEDLLFSISVDCGGYTVLAGGPLAATVSFTCSDIGLNTVPVQATNDNGATSTCSAIVNVIAGTGGGTLVCPGDIIQDNDPGICGAVVTYTVDSPAGCGGTGTLTQTAGFASGDTFPVGTTTNTFEYDDGTNPVQTCSFDVTINDTNAPIPDMATLPTVTEQCSVASLTPPTATDACAGSVTGTTTTTFPISASTTVVWTYTDGTNTSTQNQTVTINDTTAPVPDVATLPTVTEQCSVASLTPPTATDACAGSVTGTTTTTFPISASTTVVWTYTDGTNTSTQNQTVTINDTTAPVPDVATLPTVTEQCSVASLTPPTATDACAGSVTGTTTTTFPITTSTTVVWTYTDGANTSTQNQTVTIVNSGCGCAATTTYTIAGGWDNGLPDSTTEAIIAENYNTAMGDISACSLTVESGATLTVGSEQHVEVQKDITNNGTIIVESTYDTPSDNTYMGSIVQVLDDGTATNNGTIKIEYTTPYMVPKTFVVMGSPMTAETRGGVFGNSYIFVNHLTGNFVPNPQVAAQFPSAENFADDNGDNWQFYNGAINPGVGYINFPQLSINDGNKTYDLTFEQGTLNTGNIDFAVTYNGNKNNSPNVLGNPYPSAIRADDFINANPMIDEVYFWNPLTPPSPNLPGAYAMNFSMEDIGMYNLLGGTAAASDPTGTATIPSGYISTAEGFGIKATAAGTAYFANAMRVTDHNNTAPRPATSTDRIWINVKNTQYQMQNTTLLGFTDLATAGLDQGYDSRRLATVVSLYTHLEDGSNELGIQSREVFTDGAQVLMGFSTLLDANLEYTISVGNIEGANLPNATVYLIDNELNIVTNLNESNYTFMASKETYGQRFTIQFKLKGTLGSQEGTFSTIALIPNPAKDMLNISNPQNIELESLDIYDIRGRLVQTVDLRGMGNIKAINVAQLAAAAYYVKISGKDGQITKRLLKE